MTHESRPEAAIEVAGEPTAKVPESAPQLPRVDALLADAHHLRRLGLRIVPVNGLQKRPTIAWGRYVTEPVNDAQIRGWASDTRHSGWAILCGNHDEKVAVVDIEGPGMDEAVILEQLERAPEYATRHTPKGGRHVVVRIIDGDAYPTVKLARRPAREGESSDDGITLLVEVRGVGREDDGKGAIAVTTGPGRGSIPDTFAPWEITRAELDAFLAPIIALDESPPAKPERPKVERAPGAAIGGGTGALIHNAVADGTLDVLDVLPPGWTITGSDGTRIFIKRPGAESANSGNVRDGMFVIHSTSVAWAIPSQGTNAPQTLAAAWFDGDYRAAMTAAETAATNMVTDGIMPVAPFDRWPRALLEAIASERAAYALTQREPFPMDIAEFIVTGADVTVDPEVDATVEPEDGATGIPKPLGLLAFRLDWEALYSGDADEVDYLVDGVFAAGHGYLVTSAAKAGKSLLMLDWAARLSTGGDILGVSRPPMTVLYVDHENTQSDILSRLIDLGHPVPSTLENLHYLYLPAMATLDTAEGGRSLFETAQGIGAALVIVDTASRTIAGPENDADTWHNWYRHTGKPLKRAKIAYVRLDHLGKDTTKGARGSSAKVSDVDAHWMLIASRNQVTLRLKEHRQAHYTESVELNRREVDDILVHQSTRGDDIHRAKVNEIVALLDSLGLPLETGRRPAREALKDNGHTVTVRLAGEAVAARKWRTDLCATPLQTFTPEVAREPVGHPAPPPQSVRELVAQSPVNHLEPPPPVPPERVARATAKRSEAGVRHPGTQYCSDCGWDLGSEGHHEACEMAS